MRRTSAIGSDDILSAGGIEITAFYTALLMERQWIWSYKEFELLTYFLENQELLYQEKNFKFVWNYDYFKDARTIDTM